MGREDQDSRTRCLDSFKDDCLEFEGSFYDRVELVQQILDVHMNPAAEPPAMRNMHDFFQRNLSVGVGNMKLNVS